MTLIRTLRPLRRSPLSLALLTCLAPLPALAAEAETTPSQLERITVTAQKREQQVADVPISISAYSGEMLRKLGITRMDELSAFVPGFHAQLQSPNNPGYVVRGITTDSGESTQTSRVSIFQDGVDISRSRGSAVALYDLDRVEVLRGPQGTLFGRGAEAGAVSLIQNKASNTTASGFDAELGNYSSHKLSAFYNTPLNEAVSARVAIYDAQHDGYVKNLSGGDLNGEDTKAARLSLHFDLEDGSVDAIFNYQKDTPPGTDFHSATLANRNGSTDVYGDSDLNRGSDLGLDRSIQGLTVLGNFRLGDSWQLNSTTGLRRFNSYEKFDADGSNLDLLEMSEYVKSKQLSQEFRFNYDGGGRVRGFVGGNVFYEKGQQQVTLQTDEAALFSNVVWPLLLQSYPAYAAYQSAVDGLVASNLNPVQYLLAGAYVPFNNDITEGYVNASTTHAVEAFGDLSFDVTNRLQLTAGLRVSHEDITSGYRTINADGTGTLGLLGLTTSGVPVTPNNLFATTNGQMLRASDSFWGVTGRLVANYQLGDSANLYASVSRGRKPNVIEVQPDATTELPAEILTSGEIGLKGELAQGKFLYDLSAFYYDYKNFQSSAYVDGQYKTQNAGRAHAPGLEMSLQHNFNADLGVLFNYTWMKARFNAVDEDGSAQELGGNRLRMSPDNSASLVLMYGHDIGGNRRFYLRPSYEWKDKMFFDDENTAGLAQKAYGLVNLRTGVTFQNGRWDVGLFGANLADEKYLIDAGNTGATFGLPTYIRGAPRTFGVSLSGRF
ncbi:TonB-dependent receptor [Pseudoxanthomonas sp.]|uniref:TonB-dependent receptor n=1 Tax=Pseudoxanthomonas sp. TaxID=1871049 RepID=UPI00260781D9|nr:TonB-dependent receptor [Pseudoxanthomonas sp.]WDS34889.1 MAG: TonB-dependent receptor [Pseudoxanthomonas sp.]